MARTGLQTFGPLFTRRSLSGPDLHRPNLLNPTFETLGWGYKTTFEMPSLDQLRVAIFTLPLHVYVQLAHKLVCCIHWAKWRSLDPDPRL